MKIKVHLNYTLLLFSCIALFCSLNLSAQEHNEKQITYYPSYGFQTDSGWIVPMRVWVSKPPDWLSQATGKLARKIIQNKAEIEELSDTQKQRYEFRVNDFLADNESFEIIRFGFEQDAENLVFTLLNINGEPVKTDFNGVAQGFINLSNKTANRLLAAQKSSNGWLRFSAVSKAYQGQGKIRLIGSDGLSVISDIDDTIKITNIPLGEKVVLNNTFFKEFAAAIEMQSMYQEFPTDVAFHYISGGPWQLYAPLANFLFDEKIAFPVGSMHMKNVRVNPFESESYADISKLIINGSKTATFQQKVIQITQILKHFPNRKFILIGDSGERDPEVYRKILGLFPQQILEIRIRDLINDKECNAARLAGMKIIPAENIEEVSCESRLAK